MTKDEQVKVKIHLDQEVSQGMYVNLALVNHKEEEFTIDVMYLQELVLEN